MLEPGAPRPEPVEAGVLVERLEVEGLEVVEGLEMVERLEMVEAKSTSGTWAWAGPALGPLAGLALPTPLAALVARHGQPGISVVGSAV